MIQFLKFLGRPRESVLVVFQLLSFIAFIWAIYYQYSPHLWLYSYLGYFLIFGLGITVLFHRYLAHRSFKLNPFVEYLFALFANAGCTGSSVGWIFVHRMHHKYSDKKGDPHSPIVHGRLGAVIGDYGQGFDKWMVRDIINNKAHRFYHDYYHLIIILIAIVFSLIGIEFLIFGYLIPVFLNTAASRLSNWIDHEPALGFKAHKTSDMSHNVWWWSLLTFGEGWHNYHHKNPWDYRFGLKWYQMDLGKSVIEILFKLNLASPRFENGKYKN